MKKIQPVVIFTIIFFNVALIFAQEKAIEKKTFTEITEKSRANLDGKTYRSLTTYESFTERNSKPVKSSKTISEIVPPDKWHSIYESENEKKEIIQIGPRRYLRLNGGEWKEDNSLGIGSGMACGASIKYESYKVTENDKLNGKTVNLYESTKKLADSSCGDESSDGNGEIWTQRFWIATDGVLLKTEFENESVGTNSISRQTTIYEYDSKIKIEAPVLKKETK